MDGDQLEKVQEKMENVTVEDKSLYQILRENHSYRGWVWTDQNYTMKYLIAGSHALAYHQMGKQDELKKYVQVMKNMEENPQMLQKLRI